MVIKEFDMAESSPVAPALPKHLYLLKAEEEIMDSEEFTQMPDGIYKLTSSFSDNSSFRLIQDRVDDWYIINYRDYFPVVDEWTTYSGGTFTLDLNDSGCYLAPGLYDFEVNMRTMMCTITPNNDGVGTIYESPANNQAVKRLVDKKILLYYQDKEFGINGQERR